MACVPDREAAMREVAQVYELIKLQQPLLLLHSQQLPASTTQLAHSLLGKALRALNIALSVMQQQQQQPAAGPVTRISVKAEPQLSPDSPSRADSQAAMAPSTATRGSKRRRSTEPMEGKKKKTSSSSATLTAVPYDDGYEWRKYGEKKINGTLFTRSYFRCTYRDDVGCLATKHVQQMDNNSDPPMFHVTYNNHHTCSSSAKANTGSSSNNNNLTAFVAGCCDMKQEPTGQHAAAMNMNMNMNMNMKREEPPLMLPVLVDLQPSSCFPHEQIPQCQGPLFPASLEQQFVVCGALIDDDGEIPSATGSCISVETSWRVGYSADMAAVEDDPLHDLKRFLFMD